METQNGNKFEISIVPEKCAVNINVSNPDDYQYISMDLNFEESLYFQGQLVVAINVLATTGFWKYLDDDLGEDLDKIITEIIRQRLNQEAESKK